MNFLKQENNEDYQNLLEENKQLKKMLMDYQNTNRKQDLELKLMMEQYNTIQQSLEKALEKVLDLEESIPLMIKESKETMSENLEKQRERNQENLKNWKEKIEELLKKFNQNQTETGEKNLNKLIRENSELLTMTTKLISNLETLSDKINIASSNSLEQIEDFKTKSVEAISNIDKNSQIKIENFNKTIDTIFKDTSNNFKNDLDKFFINWRRTFVFLPGILFLITFLVTTYIYFTSVNDLREKNSVLQDRLESIYYLHLADKKFWYDSKNQELLLKEDTWLQNEIKTRKEKAKK